MRLGAQIGADVPFFIQGGTSLVEGIGERITPIAMGLHSHFILIITTESMSTKAVYEAYDKAGVFSDLGEVSDELERSGCLAGERSQLGDNDLKAVVFAESNVLREAEVAILDSVKGPVYMS